MLRIAKSLITIVAVLAIAAGATGAYFIDSVTSNGNSFGAGTLALNVDGSHSNSVKFNVSNMVPGNQPIGTWQVTNVGSIAGYLDLENIVVTNLGGTYTDAEGAAGDPTNLGDLGNLLSVNLFVDNNGDGWFTAGDQTIYSGAPNGLAASYNQNLLINSTNSNYITLQVNWFSHPGTLDNMGQGDTMQLDLTFELAQTPGQ